MIDTLPQLRNALSAFPSGVTIAATTDAQGRSWGFTASSFSAVSMDPPLVSVCLARTADSHAAFARAASFSIAILARNQRELAMRFASKGADKFGGGEFRCTDGAPPVLPGAVASLVCALRHVYEGGDHAILVGEVQSVQLCDTAPLVYCQRAFWDLEEQRQQAQAMAA